MRKATVWVALVAFLSYSVFFPPRKAARLDPIEALRHE
jgi:ABC-type antimicrobial peptide transport system permease subunit